MAYTRKKYKNGRPRQLAIEANGQATNTANSNPKRYAKRENAPPPADNYLRKVKVNT